MAMAPEARAAALHASKWMSGFVPKALPHANLGSAPGIAAKATQVATKSKPTQAISRMAVPQHLAKTNPAMAIQAGRQYGAPVVANAHTLDQLSRTSFDKLSRRS